VTWYFAPPGAQLLGVPTTFTSSNWDNPPLFGQDNTVGEARDTPRVYSKGQNLWGYTGQCHTGSDDQWASGITAADYNNPPAALPDCCRPPFPNRWFLRPDLHPFQKTTPGAYLGVWTPYGVPYSVAALSTTAGTSSIGYQGSAVDVHHVGPLRLVIQQFLSDALPGRTIAAANWLIGLAGSGQIIRNCQLTMAFSLRLMNPIDWSVRQTLFTLGTLGPLFSSNPFSLATFLKVQAFPAVVIQDGDVWLLEIGWAFNPQLVTPTTFYASAEMGGSTAIVANGVPVTNPAAFFGVQ
jgi:hypothetical protein